MMRERGPIIRTYASRGWFVVGFDAVQTVFKDPRFGADMRKNKFLVRVLRAGADGKQVPTLDNPSLLTLDAPDHTRLRKLVSRGFLNKNIQSLEPQISAIVARCLSCIGVGAERFDVIAQLAKPLPAIVISHNVCQGVARQTDG
jgi:cytochrome P450